MIVRLHNYDPLNLYSKLQHNQKTKSFSFDYDGVRFESDSYLDKQEAPITFTGILDGIKISEYDFACKLACDKSTDFECFVEVKCTRLGYYGQIIAYENGKCIKEAGEDSKLLARIIKKLNIGEMCE